MKRRRNCGIYKILNQNNGKFYIGSAVSLSMRWREHVWQLSRCLHPNRHLQSAWTKHGEDAFVFVVLERIEDETKLVEREQSYLDELRPFISTIGYNLSPTAGSTLGIPCTPEKAAKIGAANRGRKQTPEHINAKAAWGRSPTEETRAILRAKMLELGVKPSPEAWRKGADARRGKPISEKQKAIVSANSTRPEHIEHLRALNDKVRGTSTVLTPEQIVEMKELRAKGLSYVQLGKRFGVSNVTAKNWCSRSPDEGTPSVSADPDRPAPDPLSSHPTQLSLL
jgi:group I intron endonuclease